MKMILDGKVALVTGAARGQGRSHAIHLAEAGAAVIAIDICGPVSSVSYPAATHDDLEATVAAIEGKGGRVLAFSSDVRDQAALERCVADGIKEFGRLDIVCANAGIFSLGRLWELTEQTWQDMIDINLTGVWRTLRTCVPVMIEAGNGGSIIITSSAAGLKGTPNLSHYSAAKHGIIGLTKSLAKEVGEFGIRVNAVCPTSVSTDMVLHADLYRLFRPDLEKPTVQDAEKVLSKLHALPLGYLDASAVTDTVLFLASDAAQYITGVVLPIDGGLSA